MALLVLIMDAPLNFYNFREEATEVALLPKVTRMHKINRHPGKTLSRVYMLPFNLVSDDKLSKVMTKSLARAARFD